ncbi:MAG: lysine exporter LysO family protein [Lachnospiraceae bacterium]|nr:lysine exporter LysO family protein [Lachnospiraceae bacterium]
MKDVILVLVAFALGVLWGNSGLMPAEVDCSWLSSVVLLVLMTQVGLGFGSGESFDMLKRDFRWEWLLLPFATVAGTLVAAAVVGVFWSLGTVADALAVGSGLGYYSLSSLLITQLKALVASPEIATQLGIVALLANVVRELIGIVGAPLFAKVSPLSPISAAGCSSCDISLPVIARWSGEGMVPLSILHGVVLDMSVPVLVTFFCSF